MTQLYTNFVKLVQRWVIYFGTEGVMISGKISSCQLKLWIWRTDGPSVSRTCLQGHWSTTPVAGFLVGTNTWRLWSSSIRPTLEQRRRPPVSVHSAFSKSVFWWEGSGATEKATTRILPCGGRTRRKGSVQRYVPTKKIWCRQTGSKF